MSDVAPPAALADLVRSSYRRELAGLDWIANYRFEDRVIGRVRFATGPPAVLRAFTGPVRDWLVDQARALDVLDGRGFPAPRVFRTASGELVAAHEDWTGLLLTYVEGGPAGFDPATLEEIGEYAASLHAQVPGLLPNSRLAPTGAILRRLAAGDRPPEAILHGDCGPDNAVRAREGPVVLVDWEGVGIGPAVFELGYLLLVAHLDRPQLPAMRADRARIEAAARGYARRRAPSGVELEWLADAVRYDAVQRAVESGAFAVAPDRWVEDERLHKHLARHAVGEEIAEIARECFTRAATG